MLKIVVEFLILAGGYAWAFSSTDPLGWLIVLAVALSPLQIGLIVYHFNGLYLSDFFLLAAVILAFASPRDRLRWNPEGLGIPFVIFLLWLLITSFAVRWPGVMGHSLSEWTRFLRAYLMFVAVFSLGLKPHRYKRIVWALVFGVFLEGFVAFLQWRKGYVGLWFLGEKSIAWRATGLFSHPTMLGEYLAMLVPLTVRMLVAYPLRPPWKRGLLTVGFFVVLGGLFGSYARAGWLGTAIGTSIALGLPIIRLRANLVARYKGPVVALLLVGVLGMVKYGPILYRQFTDPTRQRSANVRKPLNWIALEMFKEKAVLGVGLDNYRHHTYFYVARIYDRAKALGFTSWYELMQVVHNSYLLLACEGGALALLLFLFFLFRILRDSLGLAWKSVGLMREVGLGAVGGLFAFSLVMLVSPNLYQQPFLMSFWALAGLVEAGRVYDRAAKARAMKRARPAAVNSGAGSVAGHRTSVVQPRLRQAGEMGGVAS